MLKVMVITHSSIDMTNVLHKFTPVLSLLKYYSPER